ncbi:hypothetical protein Acr_08g0000780 [Actinidia rufa]|uniref:Uncharacterized protein n=1 Tax=Actinidia rufa TaxID=165716 RepID=A0A7J0EZ20_9ERIC|nr:hypothetical protein Acr_08g0000780 [Actinidia rufa]
MEAKRRLSTTTAALSMLLLTVVLMNFPAAKAWPVRRHPVPELYSRSVQVRLPSVLADFAVHGQVPVGRHHASGQVCEAV